MCPHHARAGRHQNRNPERPSPWNSVHLAHVRNAHGPDALKRKPSQAITPDLDLNDTTSRRVPIPLNTLAARVVEHVEEHSESIAEPQLTGRIGPYTRSIYLQLNNRKHLLYKYQT